MSKLCWLPEHAEQLKRLRLAAGVEITTLDKKHSLSSAQVRQLQKALAFIGTSEAAGGKRGQHLLQPRDQVHRWSQVDQILGRGNH